MTGGLGLKREEAAATANFSGSCSSCDPGWGLLRPLGLGSGPERRLRRAPLAATPHFRAVLARS